MSTSRLRRERDVYTIPHFKLDGLLELPLKNNALQKISKNTFDDLCISSGVGVEKKKNMQIREIGEQGLLKILQGFCPESLVGDDGAVLPWADFLDKEREDRQSLVVTTDLLVEGVHFSDRTTSPADAGWRAIAANLSDLAAMGAKPLGVTVGLGLRGETTIDWVEKMYQGMTDCLEATPIVGGDVVNSPINTIAITAFGRVDPRQVIKRSAARVGDAIVITGSHGKSKAGLEILLHPEEYGWTNDGQLEEVGLSAADRLEIIKAHQRPQPRLDVLPYLAKFDRVAGMDSSDGLADAICQICRASQVGARIDRAALLIPDILTQMVPVKTALDWVLYGGEDFELVLCLPWIQAIALVQKLGSGAAIIGTIAQDPAILLLSEREGNLSLSLDRGFQHF